MSINIKVPDETFNFSEISLGEPSSLLQGFFFSSIKHNDDLFIQTPCVSCKSGFVKSGSKYHMDIILKNEDEKILEWFENLENRIKMLIYEKRNDWFNESNIEMSDIENIFISPIRSYKSGKQFTLRCHVESAKSSLINPNNMKIFDTDHNNLNINDVNTDSKFLALLQISGVKFSSRTFQIYTEIKQVMIINKENIFNSCLIKTPATPIISENIKKPSEDTINNKSENTDDTAGSKYINEENDINNEDKEIDISVNSTKEVISPEECEETNIIIDESISETSDTSTSRILDNSDTPHNFDTSNNNTDTNDNETDNTIDGINDENLDKSNTYDELLQEVRKMSSDNLDNKEDVKEKLDNGIQEFNVNVQDLENYNIDLQNPDSEYVEKYKTAVKKAKELRKEALQSHLEAQNIKAKYLLNVYSDSDSDESVEIGE